MTKVKRKCRVCGKHFFAKQWHVNRGWAQFCSMLCKNEGQKQGQFEKCAICCKKTWKTPQALKSSKSGKFFCGKSCQAIWRNKYYSGRRHALWKNGVSTHRKILQSSNQAMICVLCKASDIRVLQAHHKNKNRSDNVLQNLVWLCINCHRLVHLYNEKLPVYARG